jgi:hypothetical protein
VAGSPKQTFPVGNGTATFLDTGDAYWNLPIPAFQALSNIFNISFNSSAGPPFPVDCRFQHLSGDNAIEVAFECGASIRIPLAGLASQSGDHSCETYIGQTAEGPDGGVNSAFGLPFLRNVYTTFNLDKRTVSVSEVNYTDREDLEAIL